MKAETKTANENFKEALESARQMSKAEIRRELRDRTAMHGWAIRALETAMEEKNERQ